MDAFIVKSMYVLELVEKNISEETRSLFLEAFTEKTDIFVHFNNTVAKMIMNGLSDDMIDYLMEEYDALGLVEVYDTSKYQDLLITVVTCKNSGDNILDKARTIYSLAGDTDPDSIIIPIYHCVLRVMSNSDEIINNKEVCDACISYIKDKDITSDFVAQSVLSILDIILR